MKIKSHILLVVVCIMFLALRGSAETVKTASELIAQAHKHDNMYTLGPEASQQKALSFYESALAAKPDEKQRLHILYRMAQLYGSAYQLEKGEKPNFHKAIELYKQIIDSCPHDNTKVVESMLWVGGHYASLQEFEDAVKWFKKTLEYDTAEMKERMESLQDNGQNKEAFSLKKTLDKIKRYQKIAVDQVAHSAERIDLLCAHGELRHIIDKHYGTFIADRAAEHLAQNIDKMPDLWAPRNDPLPSSNPVLQTNVSAPPALAQTKDAIKTDLNIITVEPANQQSSIGPNTTEKSQNGKHVAKEPRAPPLCRLKRYFIGAAGLIILILAGIIIKKTKNRYLRNLKNEIS